MIDKINPMNFDITKNLHGHVRVETRDRWTGRVVDSQEKDNLATNALQKQLILSAWGNYSSVGANTMLSAFLTPFYYKALGGLLLFNGTLTASADNIWFPSSVKLVGCAGQTSDTTNAIMGSLNAQESVHTSNGFTTTWDFLTSQANGTIASLARTYFGFPYAPWRDPACNITSGLPSDTITGNLCYMGYDESNCYLFFGLTAAQTINGVTYPTNNIYRATVDFSSVRLLGSIMPPASRLTVFKTLTSSDGTQTAWYYSYDKYDNNFFWGSGTTLHLIAIDGTHSTKTLPVSITAGAVRATANYYWGRNGNTIYLVQKSNMQLADTFTVGNSNFFGMENDVVACFAGSAGESAQTEYLYPDGTKTEIPSSLWTFRNMRQCGQFYTVFDQYDTGRLNIAANYLGTIANLNSPVTKTSSQTMKITYTLSEA